MLNVIAFDAARRCTGYAYKNQAGGWVTGTFNIFEHDKIIRVIKEACMDGVTHAAIEDCYLKNSVSTLKALQDAQSRIAQRCEDAGLLCTLVKAIPGDALRACVRLLATVSAREVITEWLDRLDAVNTRIDATAKKLTKGKRK